MRRTTPGRHRPPWWVTESPSKPNPLLAIECPQCGAGIGNPCIDKKGRLTHAARREALYLQQHPPEEAL
jgi:hypothetical protein